MGDTVKNRKTKEGTQLKSFYTFQLTNYYIYILFEIQIENMTRNGTLLKDNI